MKWKIDTRQEVEKAINEGKPLDSFVQSTSFKKFCQKKQGNNGESSHFGQLSTEDKLLQWVRSLKESLPCFIFGVSDFDAVAKTDKKGATMLGADGQPVYFHSRKHEHISQLSALFMFDADHLPMDPAEVYHRTQKPDFPWELCLAHKTSSGHGLRLVCEVRPELGNIADNQIELASELSLLGVTGSTGKPVVDDSCIDATRISYCPRREDIYFINEQKLFNINKYGE